PAPGRILPARVPWLWSWSLVALSLPSDHLLQVGAISNVAASDERCRTARARNRRGWDRIAAGHLPHGVHAIATVTCTAPSHPEAARARRRCASYSQQNSEPGQRRPTRCRLPLFGHRDQAFALGQFPGGLARAPDGFRFLAGLALRRFFIRPAAFHLTKNALALHLLFEDPESLIDIVVANEYLQNVSNLLLALHAPSSC